MRSEYCLRLIASVIIEPLLLGAGGMLFVDPLWQRALIDVAKMKRVPVIFDEVASGLYRLGVQSCREILHSNPDIAAYAKTLTGGVVPMSVTLTSKEIFDSFVGDNKSQALLHGHSYTAHPVGCVSAIHALETYLALIETGERSVFGEEKLAELSKIHVVRECMSIGTVLSVKFDTKLLKGSAYVALIIKLLRGYGVYARPLGDVIYLMASFQTTREDCDRIMDVLTYVLNKVQPSDLSPYA